MKIIMAGQNFRITGGSDRVFFDEIELLESFGHDVAPFCGRSDDNFESEWSSYFPKSASFTNPGIGDVVRFMYSTSARRNITKLIEDFQPDLAHLHIYYGKLTSSILPALKAEGIPIVQTLHEYKVVCPVYTLISNGEDCSKCKGFNFYHALLNKCNKGSLVRSAISGFESYLSHAVGSVKSIDRFIAVSDFLRSKVIAMGVPEEKVTTIHNFTDTAGIVPFTKTHNGAYLFFGRLEANKGIWPLVHAFAKMPKIELVVVGDGGERSALEKYVEDNKLNNISLLGFRSKSELARIIGDCKCVLVPSIWNETFGLTITEAFAHGKTVIASRIGAIPEIVIDRYNGLLVEPGSVEDLIDAILYFEANPEKMIEMASSAVIDVTQRFSKSAHYEKLHGLYSEVLSGA